ncbi:MAG: hypothetical protein OQK73_02545 [Gammaproteobacteria bacterium]|nr:hypothetical protein [Gammaproteobacteria bacterium]
MNTFSPAVEIDSIKEKNTPSFSVFSLVTDHEQYRDMLKSYLEAGFTIENTEFFYVDNSNTNKHDAYTGTRNFFNIARGKYLILSHQDILLHDHKRPQLEQVITEMDQLDPNWAILGNAGGIVPGKLAVRITDYPYGENVTIGNLPAKVTCVDGNFMLIKREAHIGLSRDLRGFHFYDIDLCLLADIMGYSSYVVDFHLHHAGGESVRGVGKKADESSPFTFNNLRKSFIKKYQRAFAPRWIQTTCTMMHISGSRLRNQLLNHKHIFSVQKRIHRWFK